MADFNENRPVQGAEGATAPVTYTAGEILKGKVTGITSFGAFIKLPSGQEGLVHISEIADTYVTSVDHYLALDEEISVKVLGKNDRGKYDLSIKQVPNNTVKNKKGDSFAGEPRAKKDKGFSPGSFDEMMDSFLKRSEEIQLDVRRNMQYKQGVKKKGGVGKKKKLPE
jgi:S1 RNA binding domain protein